MSVIEYSNSIPKSLEVILKVIKQKAKYDDNINAVPPAREHTGDV